MNTASLELCKELYELSGWEDTEFYVYDSGVSFTKTNAESFKGRWVSPAYDLGYLLRKLPAAVMATPAFDNDGYIIDYGFGEQMVRGIADTPEDAAAKLAIELFKQGVLTKEEV